MDHMDGGGGASSIEAAIDLVFNGGVVGVVGAAREAETDGDAETLTTVLAHLAGVRAAAEYRILTAASQLHDECHEEYLVALAEHRGERPSTPDEIADHAGRAAAGDDPFERYGPDGMERAVAHLGVALGVTPFAARSLIRNGHVLRHRLPRTGEMLALGRIDRARFDAVVAHTDLVADESVPDVDSALAARIAERPPMAFARFVTMVDAVIARIDPEAIALRAERVARDRTVTVRPDRRVPGQSRLSGRLTTVGGARVDAALDALAADVHADDPRGAGQRRADALVALTEGRRLACECPGCADRPDGSNGSDEATGPSEPAALASAWFHIVVNLSTLIGADDDLAYLDGHGVLDATTVRDLLAEAKRSYVHTAAGSRGAGLAYRASPRLADLVRCGELWCSFPGCGNPVWRTDLDHLAEFDHAAPGLGGQTTAANLGPMCRLHHRIKTFTDWRDYRDEQHHLVLVSPAGRRIAASGFSGHDLFPALRPVPPGGTAASHRLRDDVARERERLRRLRRRRRDAEPPPPF